MAHPLMADVTKILGGLARVYAQQGKTSEVAILAHSKTTIEESSYDNWNGGTYGYRVSLQIPAHLYAQIAHNHGEFEARFCELANDFARAYANEFFEEFVIITELPDNDDWISGAKSWLRGEGVSNQGRARSDSLAPKMFDGLLFRSQPEIEFYRALKAIGVAFAPLPVFVRGGKVEYRRIEPDFLIIKDGVTMIVEVDGDAFHPESPQEAHTRLTMLIHEGVHVERVNSKECETAEKAKDCAAKILRVIEKLKTNK